MPAANNPPITRRANEPSASAGETPPVLGRDGAKYCEAAAAVALAVAEALAVALAVGLGLGEAVRLGDGLALIIIEPPPSPPPETREKPAALWRGKDSEGTRLDD
jgi:hypothetical protein